MTLKRYLVLLAFGLVPLGVGPARAQDYSSEQLEALVAPIALYPDTLVFSVLRAALHPNDVVAAANGHGVDNPDWDPDVRALVGFPELLERMAENPLWMRDLAYAGQRELVEVMQALAALRARAAAAGTVGDAPSQALVYYDPLIVYGAWRPKYPLPQWRQWSTRRSFAGERRRSEAPRNGPPSEGAQIEADQAKAHASGNGPPSEAARIEADQAAKARTRGNGDPSPAQLLEQKRP